MSGIAIYQQQAFPPPASDGKAILPLMTPFPKPRGLSDYTLFALAMAGGLVFLFWLEASDGVGWHDAAVACGAAVLFVFATILARGGEKARWIAHPTWHAHLLISLGAFVFMFGAIYADAYLLHPKDLTSNRLRHDVVPAVLGPAALLWSLRRRSRTKQQVS